MRLTDDVVEDLESRRRQARVNDPQRSAVRFVHPGRLVALVGQHLEAFYIRQVRQLPDTLDQRDFGLITESTRSPWRPTVTWRVTSESRERARMRSTSSLGSWPPTLSWNLV